MSSPCDGKCLDNRYKFSSHSVMVIPRRCRVAPGTAPDAPGTAPGGPWPEQPQDYLQPHHGIGFRKFDGAQPSS